ncbi:TAP-like protein-domain-containing protein [Chaetomium fimeti]|uniref:TAP-like protein-domain-containing protein n=1 Tax=Chaetomium fimeti TaxID=1854472 RepID=A0AAE0LNJ4_9PEZI|nr:TAP-like protein-domain-containing protein [Chaetomium fimeti]
MRQSSPSRIFWSTLLLSCPAAAFHAPLLPRQFLPETFDWSAITPTPELQYHPCYNNTFQCARLRVPLDWSRPETAETGPHAALGIITLPATVPVTDPAYGGPLLINPGGPAGPVAEWVRVYGSWLQGVVDTPGERHHDIVGIDPRGLWRTTPPAVCYADQFGRAAAAMAVKRMPSVLTPQGLRMVTAWNQGVSRLCEEAAAADGEDSIFNHMSTASVARDFLEVVERSHEMMMKAGKGKGKRAGGGGGEKPMLQYLGLSYGSILGSTFASMFPDRVGRMVVDGIADAEDFNSGQRAMNIIDAEDAIDVFYNICFDAGELCPLYQTTDASAADIRARIDAFIHSLEETPVSAIFNNRVFLISPNFIRSELHKGMYTPIPQFPTIASSLAAALAGNFTPILSNPALVNNDNEGAVCADLPDTSPPTVFVSQAEANLGISCGDSQAAAGPRDTLAWAEATVARIANQSASLGETWANLPLNCAGWRFSPPYAFRGPFGSPAPPPANSSSSAAPMLILSSRIDHVTPLVNAYRLSSLHGGSAVVVQESLGHLALTSSVSKCTRGFVKEYLRTGALPKNGTVCEADCVPGIPFRECVGLPP